MCGTRAFWANYCHLNQAGGKWKKLEETYCPPIELRLCSQHGERWGLIIYGGSKKINDHDWFWKNVDLFSASNASCENEYEGLPIQIKKKKRNHKGHPRNHKGLVILFCPSYFWVFWIPFLCNHKGAETIKESFKKKKTKNHFDSSN